MRLDRGVIRPLLSWLAQISIAAMLLSIQAGCSALTDTRPQEWPDADMSDGWIGDYRVGDRFRTKKPMFLTVSGGEYSLNQPGLGSPDVDQYGRHPENFRGFVVRLYPPGLEFTIVGIKDTRFSGPITFVDIPGVKEWVHVVLGRYRGGHDVYNREFLEKIEQPGELRPAVKTTNWTQPGTTATNRERGVGVQLPTRRTGKPVIEEPLIERVTND